MKWILVFTVLLDGREIGTHSFTMREDGVLVSQADFRVRFLGLSAYRYRHEATERWRDGCLQSMVARTDDNGERKAVDWRAEGARCTMSFAYWDPRILGARELLNAETGRLEPVRVSSLGEGRYRLAGEKLQIDLRYDAGRWVGLESTVDGRRLTYRLGS